jgi:hypothetical protein
MDPRRELDLINKHFRKHHSTVGETVIWYEFNPLGSASVTSQYDDVYDEGTPGLGGKRYLPGVVLPTLLISETEDQRRAIPEGRQPVQNIDLTIAIQDMRDAGISTPYEYRNHLNDLMFYDGRYYSVFDYRVRGRLQDDIFVMVQGLELYINQEFLNDPDPGIIEVTNYPWPASLPSLG